MKKDSDDAQVDPHLFEFFVYHKMYRRLDKGLLCCNESVSYCDIDHDLISDALVDDVEKIANEFGYPKIPIYCDERLDAALMTLDSTWNRGFVHKRDIFRLMRCNPYNTHYAEALRFYKA